MAVHLVEKVWINYCVVVLDGVSLLRIYETHVRAFSAIYIDYYIPCKTVICLATKNYMFCIHAPVDSPKFSSIANQIVDENYIFHLNRLVVFQGANMTPFYRWLREPRKLNSLNNLNFYKKYDHTCDICHERAVVICKEAYLYQLELNQIGILPRLFEELTFN